MLLTFLRLALLLATLGASLHVAAAPHFWTLTGVRFEDGTVATGYFSYDDATQAITSWNVHVGQYEFFQFPPFTYVPGNSRAYTVQTPLFAVPPTLWFSSPPGTEFSEMRDLQITPLTMLDGSTTTVPIITYALDSRMYFVSREDLTENAVRLITAGSLTLMLPPGIAVVQVDEFHNPVLGHYFITASAAEKQDLDAGVHPNWTRTRQSFKAYVTGSGASGSINPVCRYNGNPLRGLDSHFYSADGHECLTVFRKYSFGWLFESDNVFQIDLPDTTTGACPSGTIPVYRLWNDSSHRYTTSVTIKEEMLAAGSFAEGYGPDAVAMCAVQ